MLATRCCGFALLAMLAGIANAQSIAGNWQGKLGVQKPIRLLLDVRRGETGLRAFIRSIDQWNWDQALEADSVQLTGQRLTLLWAQFDARFSGVLSTDGSSIVGHWTQNGPQQPVTFERPTAATEWRDPSPHRIRYVAVSRDVKLEVLEWGGSGRPVVLLSGLGDGAHAFDMFGPKLAADYHVYAITRRGFGNSTAAAFGFKADSLADDVLAVIDSLHLTRPLIVGHSIAGGELSSIGSRRPEKVSGLVYLDAAFNYAFYDSTQSDLEMQIPDVHRKLLRAYDARPPISPRDAQRLIQVLLDEDLPRLERDLRILPSSQQPILPTACASSRDLDSSKDKRRARTC